MCSSTQDKKQVRSGQNICSIAVQPHTCTYMNQIERSYAFQNVTSIPVHQSLPSNFYRSPQSVLCMSQN